MSQKILFTIGCAFVFIGILCTEILPLGIFLITLGVILMIITFSLSYNKNNKKINMFKSIIIDLSNRLKENPSQEIIDIVAYKVEQYAEFRKELNGNINYLQDFTENNKCLFSNDYELKTLCYSCYDYITRFKGDINTSIEQDEIRKEIDFKNGEFDFISLIYTYTLAQSIAFDENLRSILEEQYFIELSSLIEKHKIKK